MKAKTRGFLGLGLIVIGFVGGAYVQALEIKPLIWLSWIFAISGVILLFQIRVQARREIRDSKKK